MEFADKALVCRECIKPFLFTAGEQEFFRQKGLVNQPGRCPECRNRRKQDAVVGGCKSTTWSRWYTYSDAPARC